MTPFWTGFLIGGLLLGGAGACFGLLLAALCRSAARAERMQPGRFER